MSETINHVLIWGFPVTASEPEGHKRVERVQENSLTAVSKMVCGNANGMLLRPMVEYRVKSTYENWTW